MKLCIPRYPLVRCIVDVFEGILFCWIVRFVKERRISWIGDVERMEDSRMPKRVMREKIYTRRKRGRPKVRWLDDVQEDLQEMGIEGWRRKLRIETSGGE